MYIFVNTYIMCCCLVFHECTHTIPLPSCLDTSIFTHHSGRYLGDRLTPRQRSRCECFEPLSAFFITKNSIYSRRGKESREVRKCREKSLRQLVLHHHRPCYEQKCVNALCLAIALLPCIGLSICGLSGTASLPLLPLSPPHRRHVQVLRSTDGRQGLLQYRGGQRWMLILDTSILKKRMTRVILKEKIWVGEGN